jgi:dipeptidase E
MLDRFSESSKKVMAVARDVARELGQPMIDAEHLFVAILRQKGSNADRMLTHLGVVAEDLANELIRHLERGNGTGSAQLPFTPAVKRVLERGFDEAMRLNARHIGTEHLLVAMATDEHALAAKVLRNCGATIEAMRATLLAWQPAQKHGNRRLLLISNSTMHGGGYLEHCTDALKAFLGNSLKRVLFVPYALADHDAYTQKARTAFHRLGHDLRSVHAEQQPRKAVMEAEAVFVGGGNTFRLLRSLYHYQLLDAIVERAMQGMPYIGSSAGTNVATPTIRTTNDMPIVQPPSLAALHLVPFQINPHYLDPDPGSKHMGETREERLRQFHEENETPVLGLREGCMVLVEGDRATLLGTTGARLFRRGLEPQEFQPPCDLSFLMGG